MRLFCTICERQTPHTHRIKTSGYENPACRVCKYCATLNEDPKWTFKPKGVYGVPLYCTPDAAIRQYRARGVKNPERLFPGWMGETILTLDTFFAQMIAESWNQVQFQVDAPNECKGATLIWLGDFAQKNAPKGRVLIFPPNCTDYRQIQEIPYDHQYPDDMKQVCAALTYQRSSDAITGIITGYQY